MHRSPSISSSLAGQVNHAQAIAAVWGQLNNQNFVANIQGFNDIHSQGCLASVKVIIQLPDAAMVFGKAQLFLGT